MFLSLLLFLSLGLLLLSLLIPFFNHRSHHNHHHNHHPCCNSSSKYGPPTYPILGCLISFFRNRHCLLHWYTHLLSESPTQTIVVNRLGARRTIVTANPQNVEHILKTNFAVYPKGKPFTDILGDFLGFGIFNVDGELWSTQRKLASHEFTTRSLREFVVMTLEEEVQNRLFPLLESASENDTVLDLQDILKRLTFDNICKVSLGMDRCCLADISKPLPPLAAAFDTASEIIAMRAATPVFAVWKMKRALNVGSEKRLKEAVKLVQDSIVEIIRIKKEKFQRDCLCGGGGDLLSRLLSAGHDGEVVRDMVISFLMAGRDTTSSAMTWLFWLLTWHRGVEKEIVREVMSLNNGQKPLDYEDLKEMNYIKACLCESMRLYPPVAWDSKHAANHDVLPDGTPVYEGDRVTYFPYGMGRMEKIWGKDRFEFRPDRWFSEPGKEGASAGLKSVSPYMFPVFQAGPRVCLGKEMAFIQMKYVVASVLRRFEFSPVGSDQPVFVPLLTAFMAGGLKVRIRKRTIMV